MNRIVKVVVLLFFLSSVFAEKYTELENLMFLELSEITSSTFSEQSYNQVPGTISVITEKEIKLYGLKNLYEVFNLIPGFQTVMSSNNQWMPIIRGYVPGANSHLKILIDHHPVNEAIYRGNLAWADFPLTDVKQIEVIRGPGSAKYGSDAFSGVINIITKKEKRFKVESTFGEFNHIREHLTIYQKTDNDIEYGIMVDYLKEDGPELLFTKGFFYGTPFQVEPITYEREKERLGLTGQFKYKNLDMTINYADNEQLWAEGLSNLLTHAAPNNPSSYTYGEISYKHEFNDTLNMKLTMSYDVNEIGYIGTIFPKGFSYGVDFNGDGMIEAWPDGANIDVNAKAVSYDVDLVLRKEFPAHKISFGCQVGGDELDKIDTSGNIHTFYRYKLPEGSVITNKEDSWIIGEGEREDIFAIFFEEIYTPDDRFSLILSSRYDDYSKAGSTFSPRTALIWNYKEDHQIKLSYGKAFFAPWAMARYAHVLAWIGNPHIEPQTINTYEISFQNFFERNFHYNVTFFYSKIYDRILLDINKNPSYNNEGNANIHGFEIEARWSPHEKMTLWGNYSYSEGEDEDLKSDLTLSVEHIGNIGCSFELIEDKLFWGSFAHLSGEQMRLANIPNGNKKLEGYITVNTNIIYSLTENWSLSLSASNLFNEDYYYPNNKTILLKTDHGSDFPANDRQVFFKISGRY